MAQQSKPVALQAYPSQLAVSNLHLKEGERYEKQDFLATMRSPSLFLSTAYSVRIPWIS